MYFKSQHLSTLLDPSRFMTFLYIGSARIFFISPRSLSIVFVFLTSQTSLLNSKPQTQVFFSLKEHVLLLVCLFFIHSSCISRFLTWLFGFCWKFRVFSKLLGFSQNFWVVFCENDFKSSCIASHLHYNYIFMHYRCVIYKLNCCVLLGLDWAEPMMLFKFACHMFMHFHAYIPSILYILVYWCCWCFTACLSLSFLC